MISQRDVDTKTNEITELAALLEPLDIAGMVVTADALHTQQGAARYIVDNKAAHYLLGVKANQPSLHNQGRDAWDQIDPNNPDHQSTQRGHGRIDTRRVWCVPTPPTCTFTHAAQFVLVERESADLNDRLMSTDRRIYVTDLTAENASPETLLRLTTGHWTIESHHWIRDVTFDEDRSQIRTGTLPRVMASLRNLAINIIRATTKAGTSIAAATRQLAYQPATALDIMGIPRL